MNFRTTKSTKVTKLLMSCVFSGSPSQSSSGSDCGLAAAPLEGEFGDAGFVEFAFAHLSQFGVLIEGRLGEWGVDALRCCQAERDSGIFGRVGCGEIAIVVTDDHVFGVSFQHARVGSGLTEDITQHLQVDPECVADAEAFGECGGVDVHHHIDQCLDFGGFTGGADVVERFADRRAVVCWR